MKVHFQSGQLPACGVALRGRTLLTRIRARVTCNACTLITHPPQGKHHPLAGFAEKVYRTTMSKEDLAELAKVPRYRPETEEQSRYRTWLEGVAGMIDGAEVVHVQVTGHKQVEIQFRTRGRMVVTLRADRVEEVGG